MQDQIDGLEKLADLRSELVEVADDGREMGVRDKADSHIRTLAHPG